MPTSKKTFFFQEYGLLLLILAVILLLGVTCYYAAQSMERRIYKGEMDLVSQILTSKQRSADAEEIRTQLVGEVQALHEDEFWVGVLRHVSIAFLISFIIILAVELHTRRLTRKDLDSHLEAVKRNVWEAIGKRLLGETIATELGAIMKEKAAKVKCTYLFNFKRPADQLAHDRDHVVVSVVNTFELRSLVDESESDKIYHFRASVSGYEPLGDLPKYILFKKGSDPEEIPVTDTANKTLLARDIKLPSPGTSIPVKFAVEIAYKLRDSEAFVTEVPMEGLTIFVTNEVQDLIGDVQVDMIHRCAELENPIRGQLWTFGRAILPGQGFYISWKEATKQLQAHSSVVAKER